MRSAEARKVPVIALVEDGVDVTGINAAHVVEACRGPGKKRNRLRTMFSEHAPLFVDCTARDQLEVFILHGELDPGESEVFGRRRSPPRPATASHS